MQSFQLFQDAIENNQLEAAKDIFLQFNLQEFIDEQGFTPLHLICTLACSAFITKKMIRFVIQNNVDIFHKDHRGNTALHLACKNKYIGISAIRYLLKLHADPNEANKNNCTPFLYACENHHSSVIELLLSYHAKPYISTNWYKVIKYGRPQYAANIYVKKNFLFYFSNSITIYWSEGDDSYYWDKFTFSGMKSISFKVDKIDANIFNQFTFDEIKQIVDRNFICHVAELCQFKPKVTATTALHMAVNNEYPDYRVIAKLLKLGIDPQINLNKIDGIKAIDLAIKNDNISIETLKLLPAGYDNEREKYLNLYCQDTKKIDLEKLKYFVSLIRNENDPLNFDPLISLHSLLSYSEKMNASKVENFINCLTYLIFCLYGFKIYPYRHKDNVFKIHIHQLNVYIDNLLISNIWKTCYELDANACDRFLGMYQIFIQKITFNKMVRSLSLASLCIDSHSMKEFFKALKSSAKKSFFTTLCFFNTCAQPKPDKHLRQGMLYYAFFDNLSLNQQIVFLFNKTIAMSKEEFIEFRDKALLPQKEDNIIEPTKSFWCSIL